MNGRKIWFRGLLAAAMVAVGVVASGGLAATSAPLTERVSVASDGSESNGRTYFAAISGNGRYVAFDSAASNLVAGDTNGFGDVFVHDRQTGITERVSVASDGSEGNGDSYEPAISGDGRYVAFVSEASNLVAGDTNNFCGPSGDENCMDVFVHDRQTGTTARVSVASDGSEGNGWSGGPAISTDGRYVAFESRATNLVAGDTNECGYEPGPGTCPDVFVHDRQTGTTERVSVASDGSEGNGDSHEPAISGDGRYVAFDSAASNLVAGDTNECTGAGPGTCPDVFVHDRQTGTTERVSVASDGSEGNGDSGDAAISDDGRYVAFWSLASNLVAGDTNGNGDVFVRDRQTAVTERVSVASDGSEGNDGSVEPAISSDGRYVAFRFDGSNLVAGDTNQANDVFVHDRHTAVTERVSVASDGGEGNDDSEDPAISGNGRYVAFDSAASNLVAGDTNDFEDVFVRDRLPQVADVSITKEDSIDPVAPGYRAGFDYLIEVTNYGPLDAQNVVVSDTLPPELAFGSVASSQGTCSETSGTVTCDLGTLAASALATITIHVTPDPGTPGSILTNFVSVTSDTWDPESGNNTASEETRVASGVTERVSLASDGTEGDHDSQYPAISDDGRYVVFPSQASNLVAGDTNAVSDVFVHDRQTGTTERVSVASDSGEGNGESVDAVISGDGRYVAFLSEASNLVAGDTNNFCGPTGDENCMDVFVHDRQTGVTERVSVASDGSEGNDDSEVPAISGDGRHVAFQSYASNLVAGDTNGYRDVFVHDRQTGTTARVSVASDGSEGNGDSFPIAMSGNGRYVAFGSTASNLVAGDTNLCGTPPDEYNCEDAFVHDRQTGVTERVSVASDGSEGNGESLVAGISGDGRHVAFFSWASNLVAGDTNGYLDVFVHDRQTGTTERVSVASDGSEGNGDSLVAAISGDGRHVAFFSWASNLVAGDTNGYLDVFVHDRQTGTTERVSVASDGSEGNGESYSGHAGISGDARYVAFASEASNLVADDTNGFEDIFVHDRQVESVTVEAGAGETVTTDTVGDGPTTWDPSETWLTTPNPGTVSIEETSVTETPPVGFHFLGQQVSIMAPSATADDPLVIVFRIDSSQIPPGEDENTVQIFKDGVQLPPCSGSPGTASPDPCVSNRGLLPDADVEITVLTSTASAWNFGVATEPPPPVGGIAELPDVAGTGASEGYNHTLLGALAAAAVVAVAASAWYGRRRRLR